jgi:hypothetical protein
MKKQKNDKTKENRFSSVMSGLSNEELMEILLRKRDEYQVEAVEAARHELEKRNLSQDEIQNITDLIQSRNQIGSESSNAKSDWKESIKRYFRIPEQLPGKIRGGAWLFYMCLLIDITRVYLLQENGIIHSGFSGKDILIALVYLFIGYMIHTGKDWARLLFFTLMCTHLVLYPFYLTAGFQSGLIFGVLLSVAFSARLFALVLLFSRSSQIYYRGKMNVLLTMSHGGMRRSTLALVVTLVFGAYMFKPIIEQFNLLKSHSILITLLIILADVFLLIVIYFIWYRYIQRSFSSNESRPQIQHKSKMVESL